MASFCRPISQEANCCPMRMETSSTKHGFEWAMPIRWQSLPQSSMTLIHLYPRGVTRWM